MRNTFIQKLSELAEHHAEIILITGDLGFGVFEEFEKKFPRQFLNAGVAEQNMTGLAAGLALEGKTVFTYSIGNFPTLRPLEQVRNDVCYHQANVKIVSIGGGFSYGSLGYSHHATEDLAIMRALPEMVVLSPCDLWEVAQATEQLVSRRGPAYLRLDKSFAPSLATSDFVLGKMRCLREGSDITLIATGGIMEEVLAAAKTLSSEGIQCRVLGAHTLKPIDEDAILSAATETGGMITVEEHSIIGGLGSAVAEVLLDEGVLPQFFHRMGLNDQFSTIVGSQNYLRKRYHMDAESIVNQARSVLTKKGTAKNQWDEKYETPL